MWQSEVKMPLCIESSLISKIGIKFTINITIYTPTYKLPQYPNISLEQYYRVQKYDSRSR